MRNIIFGAIGVLWGAAILVSSMSGGSAQGSGAYANGAGAATFFAVLLLIAGGYYLVKGIRERRDPFRG